MKKTFNILLSLGVVACVLLSSCRKQDEIYKEWYELGNSRVYPEKAADLRAMAGYYRAELSWKLPLESDVTGAVIYWNNGASSKEVDFDRDVEIRDGRLVVFIDDLKEKDYTFDVYTKDSEGHKSLKSEVIANIYGDEYIESLTNRPVASTSSDGSYVINWDSKTVYLSFCEVKYMSKTGEKIVTVPTTESVTELMDYDSANPTPVQYRSAFKLDSSVDILYKPWVTLP